MPPERVSGALMDAVGTAHEPAVGDVRIVSLVPSITELLFALDLGSRVVGRTSFCVHPAQGVAAVKRVGGTKTVNLDKVRRLHPTHVIVNVDENTRGAVEELRSFVPGVLVTHPLEPTDNLNLYRLLGRLFHRSRQAERLCREFDTAYCRLWETAKKLPSRRVLYLIWKEPWMTVSRDTYISRMLSLLRWETLGNDATHRYPRVRMTNSLLREAELVLFSTEPYPFKQEHLKEFRAAHPCFAGTAALIDAQMTSWYGSRAIKGLEYLRTFGPKLLGPKAEDV